MKRKTSRCVAIVYDFDGTLIPENMQENRLIPYIERFFNGKRMSSKHAKKLFWKACADFAYINDVDETLSYMYQIVERSKNNPVTKRLLRSFGRRLVFFEGVLTWFDRINNFAEQKGLFLEHYAVSSGLKPMILSSKIGQQFKNVWASDFHYNQNGKPIFPSRAINYNNKVDCLFKIAKDVQGYVDYYRMYDLLFEKKQSLPYENMIYIGDNEKDFYVMNALNASGGKTIMVYDPKNKDNRKKFHQRSYIHHLLRADYSVGSELDCIIKRFLIQKRGEK